MKCCVIFAMMVLLYGSNAAYASFPEYFGASSTLSHNLKPFPKWTGVLQRHNNEKKWMTQMCQKGELRCPMYQWQLFINSLKGKPKQEQIERVNREMNRAAYILDIANWGVQDYWATPLQFFNRDGDCEDYAIAKYMSLKALGFSVDDLRIVVLNDSNMGILHAVLVVNHNNTAYVLDNYTKSVLPSSRIYHYKPIYSINESAWWRHR